MTINIDSKMPNIALEKIKMYHTQKGDEIYQDFPLLANQMDKIYVSTIFSWNKKKAEEWINFNAIIGGSGYDLVTKLPSEIDRMKPKINIGFTTRGCIRKCKFCIVPKKEGRLYRDSHISEFWDRKSKTIEILDNNWLADKEWFFINSQYLIDNNIQLIENGMDIRLLTNDIAKQLSKIKFKKQLHFAWDNMQDESIIIKKLPLLKKYNLRAMFYILINYNTTIEQDLYRRNKLNEWGYDAYVMLYDKPNAPQIKRHIARWNNRFYFRNLLFRNYLIQNLSNLKGENDGENS